MLQRWQAAEEALQSEYGLRSSAWSPLSGGFIHDVWRVETPEGLRAVKLYRGSGWTEAQLKPTTKLQMAAYEAGLPVPRLFPTRAGRWLAPTPLGLLSVQTYAEGERFLPADLGPQRAAAAGAELGRLHRVLAERGAHDSGPAPPVPSNEAVRERSESLLAAALAAPRPDEMDRHAAEAARWRLQALERKPLDPRLYDAQVCQTVHGDYHPGNLLFSAGGQVSGIVDWDFAGSGWRGLEVARALVECSLMAGGTPDRARALAFLRGYRSVVPLEPESGRQIFRLWFNHLLWSLYPLPLRYQAAASMPQNWRDLAMRRHRMLLLLDRFEPELAAWVAAEPNG